jgi:3-phosphoshikimate 1-carboxyvinyltransferase
MAVGETRISGLLEGEDVVNTAKSMRALGALVERTGDFAWSVRGVGVGGFAQPQIPLDFGNSGTGCRLVMGAVAGCPINAVFDGDASLRSRPMRRVLDPLELMGAKVSASEQGGRLPLTLEGARDPLPIVYRTPVASAQIKSAVLLAGLAAPGVTTVIEQEASRDHTELMLKHFGAEISSAREGAHGRTINLTGQPELHGAAVAVPADPSSAAFPIVAALIVEGSDIVLSDVMTNPLRTGLFTTLREMGALIEESETRGDAGEPMARLRVRASRLRGIEVPPERAPSMIDEYLVLAVAASFAEGTTIMRGLKELRVKESDRLAATAAMLRVNGVKVEISGDDLIVEGTGHVPGGGLVATHMDHRIAMSALVMGLASDKPVKVDDTAFIATSFPDFVPMMRSLGAEFS